MVKPCNNSIMKKTKKTVGKKAKRKQSKKKISKNKVGLYPITKKAYEMDEFERRVSVIKGRYKNSLNDKSIRLIVSFLLRHNEFLVSEMNSQRRITPINIIEGTIDYKKDHMKPGLKEENVVKDGLNYADEVIEMLQSSSRVSKNTKLSK